MNKLFLQPRFRMACLVSTAACILNLAACGNDSVVSQGKETTVSGSSVNHSDWLAAWTAAPTDAGRIPPLLPGQVLRQMIAPHADGETLRLKLSNELGGSVISLASVTVGLQETGASIKKGTLKPLLFKGQPEVTIEPGEFVYSDLIAFPVRAFGKVAISLSPVNVIAEMPHHFTAREVPYIAIAGASTDQTGDNGFVPLTADVLNSWSIISSLEVEKKDNRKTIVALGDSITDGFIGLLPSVGSPEGVGQDVRYPDFWHAE